METWQVVLTGVIIWFLIAFILGHWRNVQKSRAERAQAILAVRQVEFEQRELFIKYKAEVEKSLQLLLEEKAVGFPWLSTAIADYHENYDKIFAAYLETKPRSAYVQAEKIKMIAQKRKLFKKEFLTAKYIIAYYEALFPWLWEFVGFNSEELLRSIHVTSPAGEEDPVFLLYS